MKKKFYLIITLTTIFLSSCALAGIALGVTGNLVVSDAEALKVDITNAAAIAGVEADRSLSRSGYRLTEEEDAKLVKFLDDGTISSILDFGTDSWTPEISFMSIGDDGSVYVCFQYSYSFGGGINTSGTSVQFIRIYPNSTDYDIIWPLKLGPDATWNDYENLGQVETWNYQWLDQDPLVKGPNGEIYFKVSSFGYNGTSQKSIYKYNPNSKEAPIKVTPDTSLTFDYFYVDSQGNLIIQSDGNSYDSDASYLRFYTPGDDGFTNIYYSSDSSTWIRGLTCHPSDNYIIINGSGVRGMEGLIKVTLNGQSDIEYEYLYPSISDSSYYSFTDYYSDDYTNGTELIKQLSNYYDYEWIPELLTDDKTEVDQNSLLDIVKVYFWEPEKVTIATTLSDYFSNNGTSLDTNITLNSQEKTLSTWINSNSADFLRYAFAGSELTADYVADNGLSDVSFYYIGTLQWASDGSLYALQDSSYWGGIGSGTSIIKILDSQGNRCLSKMELEHSDEHPTQIKVIEDELYYVYSALDSYGEEIGIHKLARINITTGAQQDLFPSTLPDLEILSFDVADSNDFFYFVGLDPLTNDVYNCKVDIATKKVSELDNSTRFSSIKVIE